MAQVVQGRARKYARDPRIGQPKTQMTDAVVGRVRTLLRSDRRVGVRLIAEELNTNREIVRQIVKEDLGVRKFSARLVPRNLTHDHKQLDFTFHLICYAMQICLVGSLTVLKRGVFNTTRKENDGACSGKHRIHFGRKNHVCLVAGQDHVCVFLRSQGDSSLWISQGQTVNQQCYLKMLTGLRECVRRKRPGIWPDKWILHHDNAPAHDELRVREFLDNNSIIHLTYPPAIFGSFQNEKMPWRDKDLLTFLISNATWKLYCEVFRKTMFKTVSWSA